MSELSIKLNWQRKETSLQTGQYSNAHTLQYGDAHQLPADAAPDWGGDASLTNPEQAFAASVSSCHMMTFLALAAKAGWPVAEYKDHAVAHLGKNPKGLMSVTKLDLHPDIAFDQGFEVEPADLDKMHQRAHRYCFIANSLSDSVNINIR